jgi:hypothetical protein
MTSSVFLGFSSYLAGLHTRPPQARKVDYSYGLAKQNVDRSVDVLLNLILVATR